MKILRESADMPVEGKIGKNVSYKLDDNGTLTISGTGPMEDYRRGHSPFYNNGNIKAVIVKNGVTSIGKGAFYDCSSFASITLPNSVTTIGEDAFYHCSSLESITIPDGVSSIDNYAFYYCTGLTSISIPSSVTSIGEGAFADCSALARVALPDGITIIEALTFAECTNLVEVTIPNSVTSIRSQAFEDCESLTSIALPNNQIAWGSNVFRGCDKLTIPQEYADSNSVSSDAAAPADPRIIDALIRYYDAEGGDKLTASVLSKWLRKTTQRTQSRFADLASRYEDRTPLQVWDAVQIAKKIGVSAEDIAFIQFEPEMQTAVVQLKSGEYWFANLPYGRPGGNYSVDQDWDEWADYVEDDE